MDDAINERIGVLLRREIEARALQPFYRAVAAEIGEARARALLADVVIDAAREGGRAMRAGVDDAGLEAFASGWEPWFRGGALEVEVLEHSDDRWRFNVTRCRYAELYRALDMSDLGAVLSCNRDAALVEGFDDAIRFERTQTLMEGAGHCDFHYRRAAGPAEASED